MDFAEFIEASKTTITAGLLGGIGGTLIENGLDSLLYDFDEPLPSNSIKNDLINVVIGGAASSVGFLLASRYAPETASNVAFLFIYFSTQARLLQASLGLGNAITTAIQGYEGRIPQTNYTTIASSKGCDTC